MNIAKPRFRVMARMCGFERGADGGLYGKTRWGIYDSWNEIKPKRCLYRSEEAALKACRKANADSNED